jgi:myosin-light-chain kinase
MNSMMANLSTELLGGEIYLQNFEKKKELGEGNFGVVFQVKEKVSNKIFAAKHIKTRTKEQKSRALGEIVILQKLSDPHIISFVDAFETPGEVILIMEYIDGVDLLERVASEEFTLTEEDCCSFLKQICRGVEYLHRLNIVHLNLKVFQILDNI